MVDDLVSEPAAGLTSLVIGYVEAEESNDVIAYCPF